MSEKREHLVSYEFATKGYDKVLMNNIVEVDPDITYNVYGEGWKNEEGENALATGELDIYQWYATNLNEAQVEQELELFPDLLFAYSDLLDTYFLAVDHCGTPWRCVETRIVCTEDNEEIFKKHFVGE